MVREDDAYRPKEERVEAAHKVRAGAYVSIHQNTWEDAAARGIETWVFRKGRGFGQQAFSRAGPQGSSQKYRGRGP